jgi:uncharacterized membrane protein YdjX (TVP38/TMEM64 family)
MSAMKLSKSQWIWSAVLAVMIAALVVLYIIGKNNGWFSVFESRESLRAYVSSFGDWAPLVFIALQFMQVIISPIPGNLTTLMGGILFGFWRGFLLSLIAIVFGSICAFLLGKAFGRPLVERVIGKKVVDKYLSTVSSRQMVVLILMFLLPVFPDDVLCLIAGLSAMRLRTFIVVMVLTRPWGLLVSALLGAGLISVSIPLWGWIIIGVFCLALFVLVIKYAPQIEERLHGWLKKLMRDKDRIN